MCSFLLLLIKTTFFSFLIKHYGEKYVIKGNNNKKSDLSLLILMYRQNVTTCKNMI